MGSEIEPKWVADDWESYIDSQGRTVTKHKASGGEVMSGKGGWFWRQAGGVWSGIPCDLGRAMQEAIDPLAGIEFM